MVRWCRLTAFAAMAMTASAAVAGQRVYVHVPTMPAMAMNAARDACINEALAFINGPSSPTPPRQNPTNGQVIAHAFDMRGPGLAAAHEVRCMADRGYVALSLTDAERKALGKARDAAARDRWYDGFAGGDLSARIAAAQAVAATGP